MFTTTPRIADGRFIRFEVIPPDVGRRLPTVDIISKATGEVEGQIKWKGRRGFSLYAGAHTVFGPVCLADVMRVMADLNAAHDRGEM